MGPRLPAAWPFALLPAGPASVQLTSQQHQWEPGQLAETAAARLL
jgi:hypothetical protein